MYEFRDAGSRYVVVIEVADDAMHLHAALVSATESTPAESLLRRWHRTLLSPASPEALAHAIVALADEVVRAHGVAPADSAIGLCVVLWATVDSDAGRVIRWRRMAEWANVPLRDILRAEWAGPVTLEHAVRAAARAERAALRRELSGPLLYVYIGQSIWSASVYGEQVLAGWQGQAGMMGHMLVLPDGPRCSCGARGHLAPVATTQALVRNYIGEASATDESTRAMLGASRGRAEAISVRQIVQLAKQDERAARAVIDRGIAALSTAVVNACMVLAPEQVILAGPMTQAGDAWLTQFREVLGNALAPTLTAPQVRWTELGDLALWHGAFALGRASRSIGPDQEKPAGL